MKGGFRWWKGGREVGIRLGDGVGWRPGLLDWVRCRKEERDWFRGFGKLEGDGD